MDVAFFIGLSLIYLIAFAFIVKMIWNRIRGNDELDGVFIFAGRKKKG